MFFLKRKNTKACCAIFGSHDARTKLHQANGDILLNCKAWNGRVVMQFLTSAVMAAFQQGYSQLDDRLPIVAKCMTLFCIRNPPDPVDDYLAMILGKEPVNLVAFMLLCSLRSLSYLSSHSRNRVLVKPLQVQAGKGSRGCTSPASCWALKVPVAS